MTGIEAICDGGATLAFIISAQATSETTDFFSSDADSFQAGFVVYPSGGQVAAHLHLPIVREVVGTSGCSSSAAVGASLTSTRMTADSFHRTS